MAATIYVSWMVGGQMGFEFLRHIFLYLVQFGTI